MLRARLFAGTFLAGIAGMRLLALTTLALFVAASSGCITHHTIARPASPAAIAEVQTQLESRGAWIEYALPGLPPQINTVARGEVRRVGGATPSLIVRTEQPALFVPLENIRSIQVNNHLEGAARGFAAGLLSGVLVGALLAPGARSSCNAGDDGCIGLDFSGAVLVTSLLFGAGIGLAVGAGVGQRHLYTF
jgi:hypothetical protein